MADKARIYLEHGASELRELERKGIFSKEETRSISRKRSEYEHRINATQCQPHDFVVYARYEMNLETLCANRMTRLKVKKKLHGGGTRRVQYILERGTRRFHGDVALWVQYVEFLRRQRASKMIGKVLTTFLKLHPSKPELWIYAANVAVDDDGNVSEARSLLQRGLHLNRRSKELWLEYTKLELVFISKLSSRNEMVRLDRRSIGHGDEIPKLCDTTNMNEVMEVLPKVRAKLFGSKTSELMDVPLQGIDDDSSGTRLLLTIFDAAVSAVEDDIPFTISLFRLFSSFPNLSCQRTILKYIDAHMMCLWPASPEVVYCHAILPISGLLLEDPEFPLAFSTTLSRFFDGLATTDSKLTLYDIFLEFLQSKSGTLGTECDPFLSLAISSSLIRLKLERGMFDTGSRP